jgi:DNA-binding response OmpR family regulator
LHTYLGRLRKKLGEYSELLETVPGMGYNLHSKKID